MRGLVVVLALGCAHYVPYKPITAHAPAGVTDEDLFNGAVRAMTDAGYSIEDKDPSAGVVRTRWEDKTVPGDSISSEFAIRATIGEGEVKLFVDCKSVQTMELAGIGSKEDVDCGDRRPEEYINRLPALRQAILTEASRRASKRQSAAPAVPVQETPPPPAGGD